MGTLFDQPERNYHRVRSDDLTDFIETASKIASKHNISVSDVIAAKHALELERSNHLHAANGDVFDEQIAGLGEIAESIKNALLTIGDQIKSHNNN